MLFHGASCKSCEIVTGRFEEECLRNNFSVYRSIAKFPSTRSPLQGPRILCLPLLPRPGILVGRAMANDLLCERMMIWSGFAPFHEPFTESHLTFHIPAFIRTLAKIAHGYAVGELGIDGFHHMLPTVILKDFSKVYQYLVGISDRVFTPPNGNEPSDNQSDPLHPTYTAHETYLKLLRREADFLAIVGVRLFAAHGTPFYECVAGPLTAEGCTQFGLPLPNQSS